MSETYLDVEAIESASSLINATLLSKGYIDKKLLFNSIDWEEISRDQEPVMSSLRTTEEVYNNDKNIINIIYSLVQSIDRLSAQSVQFNKVLAQKDDKIAGLEAKVKQLETEVVSADKKINEYNQMERNGMNKRIRELSQVNKLQSQDLSKLKRWCDDLKAKYRVEVKKKNLEIDQLKDKLLDKRNLSSTITYGLPLVSSFKRPFGENPLTTTIGGGGGGNPLIVYNNNPSVNNAQDNVKVTIVPPRVAGVLSKEYENIIVELTQLVDNLITENYQFSQFVTKVNNHFHQVNNQISSFNSSKSEIQLPNPSDSIDLKTLEPKAETKASDIVNELQPFELLARPLLNNVYKNYHYLNDLVAYSTSVDSGINVESKAKIERLTQELAIMQRNWEEAISALEEWKKVNVK